MVYISVCLVEITKRVNLCIQYSMRNIVCLQRKSYSVLLIFYIFTLVRGVLFFALVRMAPIVELNRCSFLSSIFS